jgi:oligopeptide/dipeptide ABC transporter ATP-binding protein
MTADPLLDVRGLAVDYAAPRRLFGPRRRGVRVLDGIDLSVRPGETLGVVGESGGGKSTLVQAIARFVPAAAGEILFAGRDVLHFGRAEMRSYRQAVQMVFQAPLASLDPRMTVEASVAEPLLTHTRQTRAARRRRVAEVLEETGLTADFLSRYPHELSGGQAQRVVIARALALGPRLLLLDEPTSALDLSIQAQILNLLMRLQATHGLTYVLISHNLAVVRHVSDRIAVLYLGEVVEEGSRDAISERPLHPYTRALFAATPEVDPERRRHRATLSGQVPSLADPPPGCRFSTRCPDVMDRCRRERPVLRPVAPGHRAACHLVETSSVRRPAAPSEPRKETADGI